MIKKKKFKVHQKDLYGHCGNKGLFLRDKYFFFFYEECHNYLKSIFVCHFNVTFDLILNGWNLFLQNKLEDKNFKNLI